MVRGSGRSKSRPGKAAGAEVAVQQRQEKWHAAVARRTCASQNGKNVSSPRVLGPLFQLHMSKNGPLWREASQNVKKKCFRASNVVKVSDRRGR